MPPAAGWSKSFSKPLDSWGEGSRSQQSRHAFCEACQIRVPKYAPALRPPLFPGPRHPLKLGRCTPRLQDKQTKTSVKQQAQQCAQPPTLIGSCTWLAVYTAAVACRFRSKENSVGCPCVSCLAFTVLLKLRTAQHCLNDCSLHAAMPP